MSWIERLHSTDVHPRRLRRLREVLDPLLPAVGRVLDVGTGDGRLAAMLMRPGRVIEGVDVLVRADAAIPVHGFDGKTLPFDDAAFDAVMFVDVLHHTDDPEVLLREALRVSGGCVVIKDHTRDGLLAGATLRFMDRVGNARHGVALPYNYLSRREWENMFAAFGAQQRSRVESLHLYPKWADWIFGRGLHFATRLERKGRR